MKCSPLFFKPHSSLERIFQTGESSMTNEVIESLSLNPLSGKESFRQLLTVYASTTKLLSLNPLSGKESFRLADSNSEWISSSQVLIP